MKNYLICIFVMHMATLPSIAQENRVEIVKRGVAEKVAQLGEYIEFVNNPQIKFEERSLYKDKTINLFINRCGPYTESGREKKGVVMETISKYRPRPTNRLMKDYLEGLLRATYPKVQVTYTDFTCIQVSTLKKVEDGKYVCTCTLEQTYVGVSRDGIPIYKDITRKTIKCYVYAEQIDEEELIVVLGDVYAKEAQ